MSDERTRLEDTIGALKQQCDELALQIHLGKAEAKEEFEIAKAKLDKMTEDYQPVKGAVEESANNVLASLQIVGEEVLNSFERIRKSM